jgi:hypothetical protein
VADFKHILNRRKNYFSHLLNAAVHRVSGVMHMEILVHEAEPLLPEPAPFERKLLLQVDEALTRVRQNLLKQEVKYYAPTIINL